MISIHINLSYSTVHIHCSLISDPSHLIHVQRFTQIIESILEYIDHTDSGNALLLIMSHDISLSDDLLSKHSISQLLSETVRLKQLGYLHEVLQYIYIVLYYWSI